jgi:hypothetical protein
MSTYAYHGTVKQILCKTASLSVTVAHANYYNAKETNIIKHFIRQSDSSRHSHCGKRLVLAKTGSPILALVSL